MQKRGKRAKVHQTLSSLNYEETSDSICLGVHSSRHDSFFKSACEFGLFQD